MNNPIAIAQATLTKKTMTPHAYYVPKSLKVKQREDGSYKVKIYAPSWPVFLACIVIMFFVVFSTSSAAFIRSFFAGTGAWLEASFLIGIAALVCWAMWRYLSPPLVISKEGVRLQRRILAPLFFPMADISNFRGHADGDWIALAANIGKMNFLGVQYGIYAERLPFILNQTESELVAIHLSGILKSLDVEIGIERDRKIQQAQEF